MLTDVVFDEDLYLACPDEEAARPRTHVGVIEPDEASDLETDDFGTPNVPELEPMDAVEAAFGLLACGGSPLALDGAEIGLGLPPRPIPLDELRSLLLCRSTPAVARDAAWQELVMRARSADHDSRLWALGAAGVALPGLRKAAGALARGSKRWSGDLDQAVLDGFTEALQTIDVDDPCILPRLLRAASRAGAAVRYEDAPSPIDPVEIPESFAPRLPWRHPDMVLIDAVAKRVLTGPEAELIGRTRLEQVTVAQVADETGEDYDALRMRRLRAEERLVRAIAEGRVRACLTPPAA
jgi:hypothetical protein